MLNVAEKVPPSSHIFRSLGRICVRQSTLDTKLRENSLSPFGLILLLNTK